MRWGGGGGGRGKYVAWLISIEGTSWHYIELFKIIIIAFNWQRGTSLFGFSKKTRSLLRKHSSREK